MQYHKLVIVSKGAGFHFRITKEEVGMTNVEPEL
jgi:hypothetical protein